MNRRTMIGAISTSIIGLAGCLGDTEYRVTKGKVKHSNDPLQIELTIVDKKATINSPSNLKLTIKNKRSDVVEIGNKGLWPLGILGIATKQNEIPTRTSIVWSKKYLTSDKIKIENEGNGISVDGETITHTIGSKNKIDEYYQIHGNDIHETGTFYLRGYFEKSLLQYRTMDTNDWTQYLPEITITVESQDFPFP